MPSNKTEDQKLSAQANELYWRSGQSVNQIAEELDLSKSRLYGLVQPLPAGVPCPECKADLLFPNRTAMEKGVASCSECSFEGVAGEGPSESGKTASKKQRARAKATSTRAKNSTNGQAKARTTRRLPQSEPGQDSTSAPVSARLRSKRVLWGSALLGVAAGLYVAIRQRRS
jgi:hypothetical protein